MRQETEGTAPCNCIDNAGTPDPRPFSITNACLSILLFTWSLVSHWWQKTCHDATRRSIPRPQTRTLDLTYLTVASGCAKWGAARGREAVGLKAGCSLSRLDPPESPGGEECVERGGSPHESHPPTSGGRTRETGGTRLDQGLLSLSSPSPTWTTVEERLAPGTVLAARPLTHGVTHWDADPIPQGTPTVCPLTASWHCMPIQRCTRSQCLMARVTPTGGVRTLPWDV